MRLFTILILTFLNTINAAPLATTTLPQAIPTSGSLLPETLAYILERDAGSIAQLPEGPWPRDDESKKHSALLASILIPLFLLVVLILVLWYFHYKSQLYWKMVKVEMKKQEETPEVVVVVTEGVRATV
ncbi:uncharacterized protein PAC_15614 [Phialocephala subalpina]|uniref:Uncharacterized protein n=1 Tax=Phialocephala subalpina TaxID=576137 RepID=A0A1L7XL27_9HELO|nr:uncharacterized protein PAC_15614 [Phialocephala subalpina]